MNEQHTKVVSIKLTSGENVIGQLIALEAIDGIMTLKQPLKLMSGLNQTGDEICMFQRFDPASANEEISFLTTHIISINPILYSFKQKYISSCLRLKLGDIDSTNDSDVFDYLTTHMMKMCEDIGVECKLDLLPISLEKMVKH